MQRGCERREEEHGCWATLLSVVKSRGGGSLATMHVSAAFMSGSVFAGRFVADYHKAKDNKRHLLGFDGFLGA